MKKTKIMSLLPIGAHTHSRYAVFCPLSFSWLNSIDIYPAIVKTFFCFYYCD